MTDLTIERKKYIPETEPVNNIPLESKIQLWFLGLLSISFLFNYALRELWIGLIFAHTAALSIMGFFGCFAGAIAKKKGYSYGRAFQVGFFLPIILGGISAFILVPSGNMDLPFTCGGWVSLATGIVVVIYYAFAKKRETSKQI